MFVKLMKINFVNIECRYWIIYICLFIFILIVSKLNGGIKEVIYMFIY